MKKLLSALFILTILVGGIVFWKTKYFLKYVPVQPDTYIVFSAMQGDWSGDYFSCTTSAYRYGIYQKSMVRIAERSAQGGTCDYPFFVDTEGEYVFADTQFAVNLNGKDVTQDVDLNVKRGVEGYVNRNTGMSVLSEYDRFTNTTFVSFAGTENAPSGFSFVNDVYRPYYIAPIMVSDDATQVYFAEYTEASGLLRSGIPIWIYDMHQKMFKKVAYGTDLLMRDYVIDPTNKRLLLTSGTRLVNNEAPGWDDIASPSEIHLVDLVTGKGIKIEKEFLDEEAAHSVQFSPVDANTFSVVYNGVTSIVTFDASGSIIAENAFSGEIVSWDESFLITQGLHGFGVYTPSGIEHEIAFLPFPDGDTGMKFRYLDYVTIGDEFIK